jgi:S-adenosylmethionine hydrolase
MTSPSLARRFAAALVCLVLGALPLPGVAAGAATHVKRPVIVFLSDFGNIDDAVAICKGVMIGIAPDAEIIDLTHQVTPFSISEGARLLARTAQYYPAGTVFVTVIDPGVGTSRKSVVVRTKRGQYFVLPDNGLVTPLVDRDGFAGAREITNPAWLIGGKLSSTFHGRDVFSPVAAHLARGEDWTRVGPALATLTRLEIPKAVIDDRGVSGSVVALDGPYGNLVTNIPGDDFRRLGYGPGDTVRVRLGSEELTVPYAATFGDVAVGKDLLFIDSRGLVSLAVNQGNFARSHGVNPPIGLVIPKK